MTEQNQQPPEIIEIGGVKYQRVEEPQPFYDKLWGLLKTKLGDGIECDEMSDQVVDLIRRHIPSLTKNKLMSEYLLGYNESIKQVKMNLFGELI